MFFFPLHSRLQLSLLAFFPVSSMNSRKYHPYGHALHRRRREEALNELRLSETIAEEEQEEEQEEQKADHEDDCERTNDTILATDARRPYLFAYS
ncbi:hypothetical protein GYMLUDRAFT_819122 [Collybiopsis luxurians FD-317 M1]|uniref:Uncharacterized protein n=1 Tax=Collybiopsis luxurians FD-317 M1 TaxID=944289 RepID=A0A0D0BN51_9AGAR|nr:hypothetical protein GYMLUDRAFT_819122 [Collybiopsis luxurians FD-317 M1]